MSFTQTATGVAKPIVATHFLTWHGGIVRIDKASQLLIQTRLFPVRDLAMDWQMALPLGGLTAPTPSPEDPRLLLMPARSQRLVNIKFGDYFLCAEPGVGEVRFSRRSTGEWETFLLVTDAELAALRYVLAHRWTDEPDEIPPPAAWLTAALRPCFRLEIGDYSCDLRPRFPPIVAGKPIIGMGADGARLVRAGETRPGPEFSLTRRPPELQAPPVDSGTFATTPDSRLVLHGSTEYGFVPLAAARSDEDWMIEKWSQPGEPRLGELRNNCHLVRERDKHVLLVRGQEGLVFDARGASNETGYLMGLNISQDSVLAREGDHIFLNGHVVSDAPRLTGPHAVFYGGNLSNYYHWIIDAMLPLHVMAPHLPPGTKLLIPGTLRGFRGGSAEAAARHVDHMAVLREWGFGDLPMVEIDAPVCHVEEVYWLDECFIDQMPAEFVQSARAAMLARLGPRRETKNIYIRRERMRTVANAQQIEKMALRNGFSMHTLEGMTPRAQMQLFQNADFIVAPHGAGLANLLFCAPGTKIIEFSPDCEFRPLFAQLSDKLDLVHAVLPCPTDDGGFHGRMTVDAVRFRSLLRQLQFRRTDA